MNKKLFKFPKLLSADRGSRRCLTLAQPDVESNRLSRDKVDALKAVFASRGYDLFEPSEVYDLNMPEELADWLFPGKEFQKNAMRQALGLSDIDSPCIYRIDAGTGEVKMSIFSHADDVEDIADAVADHLSLPVLGTFESVASAVLSAGHKVFSIADSDDRCDFALEISGLAQAYEQTDAFPPSRVVHHVADGHAHRHPSFGSGHGSAGFPKRAASDEELFAELKRNYDRLVSILSPEALERISSVPALPSRLHCDAKGQIILEDYNMLVTKGLFAKEKSFYILFLRHPEGIKMKELYRYEDELFSIYRSVSGKSKDLVYSTVKGITEQDSEANSLVSRIKSAFEAQLRNSVSDLYIISGKRGDTYTVKLDRKYVEIDRLKYDDQ